MKNILFLLLMLAVIFCTCVEDKNKNSEDLDLQAIQELHEKDKAASLQGDIGTLLSLFTEDGIVIPAEGEIIRGKEGLKKMLEKNFKDLKEYTLIDYNHDFKEIKIIGEYAYEWGIYSGTYTPKKNGNNISGSGKLMRILKRQKNGSWKISRSIWTVDK
jgi:uncharacterized protein (TIGR02246 family)